MAGTSAVKNVMLRPNEQGNRRPRLAEGPPAGEGPPKPEAADAGSAQIVQIPMSATAATPAARS